MALKRFPENRRKGPQNKRERFFQKLVGGPDANSAFSRVYMKGGKPAMVKALAKYERGERAGEKFNAIGFLETQQRVQRAVLLRLERFIAETERLPLLERERVLTQFQELLEEELWDIRQSKGTLVKLRQEKQPFVQGERFLGADMALIQTLLKALKEKTG
ncbi:MAG: hypothetical protein NT067_05305 [Candidatus Diapherotrites archaeon]|nr:hypothetical protein [Candidatus Diapherotrites archaeon]